MTRTTRLAALALLTISGGLALAPAASASTIDEVVDGLAANAESGTAAADAAGTGDPSTLSDACAVHLVDLLDFKTLTRPAIVPRASWRHMRRSIRLEIAGTQRCVDGDFVTGTPLIERAAEEMTLATENLT